MKRKYDPEGLFSSFTIVWGAKNGVPMALHGWRDATVNLGPSESPDSSLHRQKGPLSIDESGPVSC